jgi:hypothetical protein
MRKEREIADRIFSGRGAVPSRLEHHGVSQRDLYEVVEKLSERGVSGEEAGRRIREALGKLVQVGGALENDPGPQPTPNYREPEPHELPPYIREAREKTQNALGKAEKQLRRMRNCGNCGHEIRECRSKQVAGGMLRYDECMKLDRIHWQWDGEFEGKENV